MKKVAVLLATGFEEIEAITVVDILRRVDIRCEMVSIEESLQVVGAHGIKVSADRLIDDALRDFDMIVLPGGMPGTNNLKASTEVIELLQYFEQSQKKIAAICAAPIVLAAADIEKQRTLTSFPSPDFEAQLAKANYVLDRVVVDGNLITSRGPGTAFEFAYKLIEALGGDVEELKKEMIFEEKCEK